MNGAPMKVPSKSLTNHRPPESLTVDFAELATGFPSRPVDSIVAFQFPTHFLRTSISGGRAGELEAGFLSSAESKFPRIITTIAANNVRRIIFIKGILRVVARHIAQSTAGNCTQLAGSSRAVRASSEGLPHRHNRLRRIPALAIPVLHPRVFFEQSAAAAAIGLARGTDRWGLVQLPQAHRAGDRGSACIRSIRIRSVEPGVAVLHQVASSSFGLTSIRMSVTA